MNTAELQIHLEVFDNKRRQLFDEFSKKLAEANLPPDSLEDLYEATQDKRLEEAIESIWDYQNSRNSE